MLLRLPSRSRRRKEAESNVRRRKAACPDLLRLLTLAATNGGYERFGGDGLDTVSYEFDTDSMSCERKGNLPRLERHHYQAHAVVFWTNTMEGRARGWLTPAFHSAFRELMLHAAARENLYCPAYILMPDHLHLLWMGMRRDSDQLNAVKFLRTQLKPALGIGREWQHQPHDHVLSEEERRRDAFARFCFYTLENPVRAKLVERATDWPFIGAIVPGYPILNPLAEGHWELFWKLHAVEREAEPPPAPTLR